MSEAGFCPVGRDFWNLRHFSLDVMVILGFYTQCPVPEARQSGVRDFASWRGGNRMQAQTSMFAVGEAVAGKIGRAGRESIFGDDGKTFGTAMRRAVPEVCMAGTQVAWGIDIGTTALKAMKLRREGDKLELLAMDVIDHERFLTEVDVDRKEVVGQTLRKFLDRNPILHREKVFVSSPGSTSFSRFVKLPPVDPKRIPDIVQFEAIQQIPFPLDQVNWDYQTFQSADSPDVEIGIFAIKKDLVTQLLNDFQLAGVTVHGVQISPLAVYNAMVYEGRLKDKGTIVLDIGADHTDLIIMDQGRLWLRTINLGGNSFTEALAKSFLQSFRRAEELKKNAPTSKYPRQIFQAMRPTFADMVQEIQRSIGYYNSGHRESKLEQIVGMGNPLRLSNLQKYLSQYLGMEVNRLDGLTKVQAEARLAAGLSDQILSMPVAYGLALQGVGLAAISTNLLPIEIARQMLWREKYGWFAVAASLFVAGSLLAGGRYYMDSSSFKSGVDNPRLQADQQVIAKSIAMQNRFNSVSDTYKPNLHEIQSLMGINRQQPVWPEIIAALMNSLPQADAAASSAHGANWKVVLQSVSAKYSPSLAPPTAGAGGAMWSGAAPKGGAGYTITLRGYTPYASPYRLLDNFRRRLEQASLQAKLYPFWIVAPGNVVQISRISNIGSSSNSGLSFESWASGIGPFGDVFMSHFLPPSTQPAKPSNSNVNNFNGGNGVPVPFQPNGFIPGQPGFNGLPPPNLPGGFNGLNQGGNSSNGNGSDLTYIDPDTHQSLANATAFYMVLNLYLNQAPPKPAAPASQAAPKAPRPAG
ncbi:MAG: type IV pilus assembly protein PilM [Phycisphaerales bacterium]|nr:type IV pilus assembly protein PilM [Phycisphaerales bacterium]